MLSIKNMKVTNDTFTRNFELETRKNVLTFCQQQTGDVSCVVWDAALVLAKYLDICCRDDKYGGNWLSGKKIVELGSGIGCVGMTAACFGADVVCTDLASTLPILEKNLKLNEEQWKKSGGSIRAKVLEWGNDEIPLDLSPDIVLLADCVYYTESIEPLLKTLELLCKRKPEAHAILSQEERDTPGQVRVWDMFMTKLKNKFNIEPIPISEQHSTYSSDDIHLMKLTAIK